MNAKSRFLCLILAFFLFGSMTFSVGRSLVFRSQEKRQASEKNPDNFRKHKSENFYKLIIRLKQSATITLHMLMLFLTR